MSQMALKDGASSHQLTGTSGMSELIGDMAGWTPGLEFKNAFHVWPSLRLVIKKRI